MFRRHDEGLVFSVKLTPKASANAIGRIDADSDGNLFLCASVTAVPEKSKANAALLKLLSKKLGLPKSSFRLIAGEQSRRKTVLVAGDGALLASRITGTLEALGIKPTPTMPEKPADDRPDN